MRTSPDGVGVRPGPPGNGRHWRTWDLEVVMWRAARWCGRKMREWVDDVLDERRRYVEENGEDPTGWG